MQSFLSLHLLFAIVLYAILIHWEFLHLREPA